MRLIYPIVILFLMTSAGLAQLVPDKERFDVVLHPGELEERTLKVTNVGDSPIAEIRSTQLSGDAKDFIFLVLPEGKELQPEEDAEIGIIFVVSPEAKPGLYTGYIYLLEGSLPAMPIRIEFNVKIVGQESYGLGMTIDDAKSASISAEAEDIAQFDLAVKNLGTFRDVASINTSLIPEGWSVTLLDGEKERSMPYDLPLDPGATHMMKLQIQTSAPGRKDDLTITATSLGNPSKNISVDSSVEFGMAIRGYNVDIKVPDRIATNKTYKGSFNIMLDVSEKVFVGIATPPQLMVIPIAQVVEVAPKKPGIANFTMLASEPGSYPLIFKLMDSGGIPMPEEMVSVRVILPQGAAVLSGDGFLYSTVVSLSAPTNSTYAIITVPPGKLSDRDLERLQDYSRIVILGNQSIVSLDAEKSLDGIGVKRIQGDNLCIECWLLLAELWQDGTSEVILSSPKPVDVFEAYQVAKMRGLPMVICEGNVNDAAKSAIKEMTKRNVTLSKALTFGEIGEENVRALQGANISIEEVA